MLQWIAGNLWTIIICAVLIGIVAAVCCVQLRQLPRLRHARLLS